MADTAARPRPDELPLCKQRRSLMCCALNRKRVKLALDTQDPAEKSGVVCIHRYFGSQPAVIKTLFFSDPAHPNNVESHYKKTCYHSNESIFFTQLKCSIKP